MMTVCFALQINKGINITKRAAEKCSERLLADQFLACLVTSSLNARERYSKCIATKLPTY